MTLGQRDELLRALRRGLQEALGDRLERLVLYGSHARGQAREGSDVDVLIVVRGGCDYGDLMQCTSHLVAALSLAQDVVISRAFVTSAQYEQEQSPFLLNVRREGIAA